MLVDRKATPTLQNIHQINISNTNRHLQCLIVLCMKKFLELPPLNREDYETLPPLSPCNAKKSGNHYQAEMKGRFLQRG